MASKIAPCQERQLQERLIPQVRIENANVIDYLTAGGISHKLHNWQEITSDHMILDIVQHGYKIEFKNGPTCLPNGLASAPRIFTKIMKPIFASLRTMGFINASYIDDSLYSRMAKHLVLML